MGLNRKRLQSVCTVLLATQLSAAVAEGSDAGAVDETAFIVVGVQRYLEGEFVLPADLSLDPALRAAATDAARAHIARMPPLVRRWLAEERASGDDYPALATRMLARVDNEIALWFLASAGPGHDDAWLQALQQKAFCALPDPASLWAARIGALQALPPARRDAALVAERDLLERWGALPEPPPRPPASVDEQITQASARIRAGGERVADAMPPAVASYWLGGGKHAMDDLAWRDKCLARGWWLGVQLHTPGSDAHKALVAQRYALMPVPQPTAQEQSLQRAAPAAADSYPPQARRLGLEGKIVVEAVHDAAGRLLGATVVDRQVTVPGIRGVRPVAFETLLDAASLARAARVDYTQGTSQPAADGRRMRSVQFVWRLE